MCLSLITSWHLFQPVFITRITSYDKHILASFAVDARSKEFRVVIQVPVGNFLLSYHGKSFIFNCLKAVFCMFVPFGDIQIVTTIAVKKWD